MSKGLEMMAATLLKSFGVDPDAIKQEAVERIAQFELNVKILNATNAAILANLKAICVKLDIPYTPPAIIETAMKQAAE